MPPPPGGGGRVMATDMQETGLWASVQETTDKKPELADDRNELHKGEKREGNYWYLFVYISLNMHVHFLYGAVYF